MGIFAAQKTLDRLEDDLRALRGRVDDLDSSQKKVTLDTAELYEKTLRLMQRMAKRYAVDEKETEAPGEIFSENNSAAEMDSVSAAIHARRNRGFLAQ